eukprot:s2565_g1.t1
MALGTAGLHLPAPYRSAHCRTSSASSISQWALPDFVCQLHIAPGFISASSISQWALPNCICQLHIAVGTAGLHLPAPYRSAHCRPSSPTSRSQWAPSASSISQWALPDFICQQQIAVGTAGLQPRPPDRSGHCRTSAATARSQWALPDFSRDCEIAEHGHCRTSARIHARLDARGDARSNVITALLKEGLPAVSMSPCPFVGTEKKKLRGGRLGNHTLEGTKGLLQRGFVPVVHGDAVLDDAQGVAILSGDVWMVELCRELGAKSAVFVTDVDGVFTKPPSEAGAELVPEILLDNKGELELRGVSMNTASHDVTGGLKAKLESAADVLRGAPSVEAVYIVRAGSSAAAEVIFHGPTEDGAVSWRASCFLLRCRPGGFMVVLPFEEEVVTHVGSIQDSEGYPVAVTHEAEVSMETNRGRALGPSMCCWWIFLGSLRSTFAELEAGNNLLQM